MTKLFGESFVIPVKLTPDEVMVVRAALHAYAQRLAHGAIAKLLLVKSIEKKMREHDNPLGAIRKIIKK
jgi:hypothetical protein